MVHYYLYKKESYATFKYKKRKRERLVSIADVYFLYPKTKQLAKTTALSHVMSSKKNNKKSHNVILYFITILLQSCGKYYIGSYTYPILSGVCF